ncbi:MAG: hypothetical protein HKN72_02205 [Gemmatimonadetes bacterium]|nr:hypothetical protein [Gemmatimonadota bacterium]NNL30765.1 hypothetical protein [Gemmatimonadota bacterium]
MMTWFRRGAGDVQILGRDPMVSEALESLDPASGEANYWFRFHRRVMAEASAELHRRRLMARLTVVDVMASWSRTVVPTAMLAAAVAALILVRAGSGSPESAPAAGLMAELPGEPVPVLEEPGAAVIFASFGPDNF